MLKYAIMYNTPDYTGEISPCLCNETDSKGNHWSFVYTKEQAEERVNDLAEVGINAWFEEIGPDHWVNGWNG